MATRVRLIADWHGCPDGIHAQLWRAGEIRDVNDSTLSSLINCGCVELVEDKMERPALETGDAVKTAPVKQKGRPRKNAR